MRNGLFAGEISPACEYCEYGTKTSDGQMVLCMKNGVVSPFYHCKKFVYSPLLRVPKKNIMIPKYNKKDFMY